MKEAAWEPFAWSPDAGVEALRALASAARLAHRLLPSPPTPIERRRAEATSPRERLGVLAREAGLDADLIDVPATSPRLTLERAAPLIVNLPDDRGFLALLRVNARTATLVGPPGVARVPLAVVEDALWAAIESEEVSHLAARLGGIAGLPERRRMTAVRVLRAPALAGRPLVDVWSIRPIVGSLREQLRGAKLVRRGALVLAAHLAQLVLFLAIWGQVGGRVFKTGATVPASGNQGSGLLLLLLGAWAVVQLFASATLGRLALDVGAALRAGLVRGAMRLELGRIRTAGVGQLLGRALDAEVVDTLALGGATEAVSGIFELLMGALVLAMGATPAASLILVALVVVGLGAGGVRHARRLSSFNQARRAMTHDLVERMIGHRTILIQDRADRRSAIDASALHDYDGVTRVLDRAEVWLSIVLPRLWLLGGLLTLAPLVLSDARVSGAAIGMSLGGVWVIYGALRRLGGALPSLSLARDAWGQIAPLVGEPHSTTFPVTHVAAAHVPVNDFPVTDVVAPDAPAPDGPAPDRPPGPPLLRLDDVAYQYPGRPTPALKNVNLQIGVGERVLVEGASGGGKSTFAALLTGLKLPSQGRLHLRGVDQRALGIDTWRRTIAGAPQFHDNHVLSTDLLFNLLMGRRWPPRLCDLVAAERVCRQLGLGPLLERMPSGLQQQVGESGWQLSHGERSRLFIARSLLQSVEARVLDESFAALDPQTLDEVLATVLSHPETLIVIAHP